MRTLDGIIGKCTRTLRVSKLLFVQPFTRLMRGSAALAILALAVPRIVWGQTTPAGLWNTISDRDGKPEAVVELREVDGEYVGTIRALLVAASPEDSICGKCTDARHNQPVVGMEILRHMRPDGDEWSGGEILDPEDGKTYRAKMKLTDGGKKLVVRGYIGFSIFGRSQTWIRAQ
jgi:uncharacterized protein (DUF2147 family)